MLEYFIQEPHIQGFSLLGNIEYALESFFYLEKADRFLKYCFHFYYVLINLNDWLELWTCIFVFAENLCSLSL